MRVAHVTATFPPYWAGTGNVAYNNARLLHERGHEVTVFTAKKAGDEAMSFPFAVERLPAWFRIGNAPLTPGLVSKLRGFDLIHLHYPYIFGAELTLAASTRFDIPLVITYHNDLRAEGVRGMLFKAYTALNQRIVLRSPVRLLATSEDYGRHSLLAKTTPASLSVGVLPNGVDTEYFKPCPTSHLHLKQEFNLSPNTPILLFVGGLDRAHHFKGVDILLDAARRVPDMHLIIVGEGDLRPQYEQHAAHLAHGRVHFLGKVPLERLALLYQGATVTVLPSVTSGEAFGMVLIESMACGTPVIASDLPGVRTVVDHQVDGLLVPPGDSDQLARELVAITHSSKRAAFMGATGREKVRRLYDWRVIGDKLEQIYQDVLSERALTV